MLRIERRSLPLEFSPEEASRAILGAVRKSFTPYITSVRNDYWSRLDMSVSEEPPSFVSDPDEHRRLFGDIPRISGGDLFLSKTKDILYYKVPKDQGIVEAGYVGKEKTDEFELFCQTIKEAVSSRKSDVDWTPLVSVSRNIDLLDERSEHLTPTREQFLAALELEKELAHRVMGKISRSESVFLSSLGGEQEQEAIQKLLAGLEKIGLITKDYVVLCRLKGQQIMRVGSRSYIDEASQKMGFKCPHCGKSPLEENIDELLITTEFGRTVMAHNYWMPVRAIAALTSLGISGAEIWVDRATSPGASTLFFKLNHELCLVQLTNQKFELKDAYLVGANIAAYSIHAAILVSTQKISHLMRSFLVESNSGCSIHFIEEFSNLENNIETIFRARQQEEIITIINDFNSLTPVNVQELIVNRILPPREGKLREASPAADKPAVRTGKGKARTTPEDKARAQQSETSSPEQDSSEGVAQEGVEVGS
ncbi:MAG: hypothetical protein HYU64_07520 [Armatimonadetes bacterium]|nr:hypothetical protein [Armatimonadota bacterium]